MEIVRKIFIAVCLVAVIPLLAVFYLFQDPSFTIPASKVPLIFIAVFISVLGVFEFLVLGGALKRLYKGLSKIANGDINHKVKVQEPSGMTDLAATINQVSQRLRESADELEKRTILINRFNRELKRTTEISSSSLSNIIHELRAPLINIDKSSAFLLEDKSGMDINRQDDLLKIINNSAKRLIRLINDLLDLNKIESGHLSIKHELMNIREVVHDAVGYVDNWRKSRNLRLEMWIPDNLPRIYADKDRITQVLVNLVSNAIKFTPANGLISIKAQSLKPSDNTQEFIYIYVENSGSVLPGDRLEKIFEKFESGPDGSSESPNTGLGLSIAKQIIQAHKGRIWAENLKEKGSRFVFMLPRGIAEKAENVTPAIQQEMNKRVLIIDDEENIRQLLTRELHKNGYSVLSASNGFEAIKSALNISFDLVITDIRMPNIEGTDCIQILRLINPSASFIVITGFPVENRLREILSENAYPCLQKPFDLPYLLEKVNRICQGEASF